MIVAIIDYGSGNLRSAAKSFERAAREASLAAEICVTSDAGIVSRADRIVLPGVGAFADCKAGLDALDGMMAALDQAVVQQGRPFLGICVGMQLMAEIGREHGEHTGFGWIPGAVVPIEPGAAKFKIPHMGWNILDMVGRHPVFDGIGSDGMDHAYFVHSYHLVPTDRSDVVAVTQYGQEITAAVARDNWLGTQFHPEKSQKTGLRLITNFLGWRP